MRGLAYLIAMALALPLPTAAHSAELGDIQLVVTTGVGSNIESASKNAAENALTQVVGTFVDTDTQIKRRKEIRDGIQSLSRSVDTRMSEFSQGSIASFQTLDAHREGDLFRVEAKVGVRLSEFRGYVRRLSADETSISNNIFAQVAAAERNSTGAREILVQKILMPTLRGELSDIRTGKPLVYEQQSPALKSALSKDIRGRLSPTTILIPVDIRLRDGVLENTLDTLENLASDKERLNTSSGSACSSRLPHQAFQNRGIVIGLHSFRGPPTLYLFNEVTSATSSSRHDKGWKLRDPSTWKIEHFDQGFASFVIGHADALPKLKVTIKGDGGATLKEIINPNDGSLFVVKDPRFEYGRDGTEERLAFLNIGSAYDLGCFGVQRGVALFPERRIFIVMNFPAADLAAVKSVEVALFHP